MTGAAFGAKNRARFDRAVRLPTEFSALFACVCGGVIMLIGPLVISLLTTDPAVIASARTYLPLCALAPILGFAAYQMDGIFIGTTQTRAMRDAGLLAVLIYVGVHYLLEPRFGGVGLWAAFLIYYMARALTLALFYPAIKRQLV